MKIYGVYTGNYHEGIGGFQSPMFKMERDAIIKAQHMVNNHHENCGFVCYKSVGDKEWRCGADYIKIEECDLI